MAPSRSPAGMTIPPPTFTMSNRAFRRINLILAIAWLIMVPVSIVTGWLYSLAFISAVSIYANFVSHVAAWRADVPDDEG